MLAMWIGGAGSANLVSMADILSAATPGIVEHAVDLLRDGEVIAIPTDTLYGLAAASRNDAGVRKLFTAKGRPPSKPLPLLVSDAVMAEWVADVPAVGRRLMAALWPGALTIVMKRQPDFFSKALAGGDTVALRAPAYGLVRDMAHALGEPITGTSANRSGSRPAATAQEVAFQLGQMVALVIDGGPVERGVESTIVDITGDVPVILREGSVSADEVEAAAGTPVTRGGEGE